MNDNTIRVTFLPDGIVVEGAEGDSLFEIAAAGGVAVATRCRANARCGCCLVEVMNGAENLNKIRVDERDYLPTKNHRLACRARAYGPVTVRKVIDPLS